MADTKITKKDFYGALIELVEGMETVGVYDAKDVQEFLEKQVAQIDAKAAKAKARAGEKKAEGDALRAEVKAVLTDEFQTREEIFAQIDNADGSLSIAKIGARLTQLCTNGEAIKENIKTETGKKMAYKLADAESDAAEDVE